MHPGVRMKMHPPTSRGFSGFGGRSGEGLLLAPGDVYDQPEHFRIGMGASGDAFLGATKHLQHFVDHWWSGRKNRSH